MSVCVLRRKGLFVDAVYPERERIAPPLQLSLSTLPNKVASLPHAERVAFFPSRDKFTLGSSSLAAKL